MSIALHKWMELRFQVTPLVDRLRYSRHGWSDLKPILTGEVLRLKNDSTYREDFLGKPLLKENASEFIEERIELAKMRILQLIMH